MKKSKIKNLRVGLLIIFLTMASLTGYSQSCAGNQVTVTLQNITNPTPTTIEFDVYIANTGTTSLFFDGGFEGAVFYNTGMLPLGATGTFTCITGPSEVDFPGQIINQVSHTVSKNKLNWQFNFVGNVNFEHNLIDNITNIPKKYARFRFTSSIPWTTNFTAILTEAYGQYDISGDICLMQARVFCNNNVTTTLVHSWLGSIVSNSSYSFTLNTPTCATAASQTASSAVTCFGETNGSATIAVSPTTIPTLIYTIDSGVAQSATLSNGAFTITGLAAGTHTVVVSNAGCSDVTITGITVDGPSQQFNTTSTTECDSYVWPVNGQIYTNSGTYTGISTNSNGCPVNETLNLIVNYGSNTSETQTACDSYTWHETTYTTSGDYTYTTTNQSGCYDIATLHLTINNSIIPTFTPIGSVCIGIPLAPLPTTSIDGVTGTWSPAINSNATTTYTFTPDAGQCATTTTQTITVLTPLESSPISFLPLPVSIGSQIWATTNLEVTTYCDGTPIPQVTDPVAWANLTTGAWCYYNNDPAKGAVYGKLYNWYAVAGIHDELSKTDSTKRKKLAPIGWHVPTDAEWSTLTTSLGGENTAGSAMKEIGFNHWSTNNTDATNTSNFAGLPGGCRFFGSSTTLGNYGFWWSFSDAFPKLGGSMSLSHSLGSVNKTINDKTLGFSVRCVKD